MQHKMILMLYISFRSTSVIGYSLVSRKPLLMLTNLLGMFICNWLVVTCNGLLADGTRENIASYFFAELFESLPYVTWAILWVQFLFWVILRCWEYFSLPWDLGLVKNYFLQFLGHCDVCVIIILYAVVLCPLSVTDGWVSEVAKFAPKLRVLRYVGDKNHRCNLRREMYEHVIEQSSPSYVSFWILLLHTNPDLKVSYKGFDGS